MAMMLQILFSLGAVALLVSCRTSPMAPPDAVAELAPTGTLRVAINFGNPVLAAKDPATGAPRGISVDLARELARRLSVGIELVTYDAAGKVVEGLRTRAWDVAFLAIDPARAVDIDYSAPYVLIEGAYLVPADSPIRSNAEVDSDGVRVVVGKGSAYDLYLSRELKRATIVRAPTSPVVADTLIAQKLDVAAGVKQQLEIDARRLPGLRLLGGRFMVINQAMGIPKGHDAGLRYLRDFVEEMKTGGFVARALERHHVESVSIAPATEVR
jgi:polar amino acid transport system substrate-binding protein